MVRLGHLWLLVTGLVVATAWPAEGRAFPDEPYSLDEAPNGARDERFHLWGELGIFTGDLRGTKAIAFSPLFGLRLQFTQNVIMDLQWGLAHATLKPDNDDSDTAFRPGNLWAAVHYQGAKKSFSYRFGLGLTAPTATLPSDDPINRFLTAQAAFVLAAAMRGNWNYWLWDPYALSIIVPLRVERRKPSGFMWGVEFDAGIMISVSDKNAGDDPIVQMEGDMGYQAIDWLRVGSRFALVILPKSEGQKTQLSVEPFLRFGPEERFVAVRLLINIDNPNGFSFDKNEVWGLRIGGGVAF